MILFRQEAESLFADAEPLEDYLLCLKPCGDRR